MAFPAIFTKYLGPTDRKGSRVKAWTIPGERGKSRSVTLGWDDAIGASENHEAAAVALARKLEWSGEMIAADSGDTGWIFCFARRTWPTGGFSTVDTVHV